MGAQQEGQSPGILQRCARFYDTHYKRLLIIPTVILFIAIFLVAHKVLATGEIINRGVSLKGGITITIPTIDDMDASELHEYLQKQFPGKDISVRILKHPGQINGLTIDADVTLAEEIAAFKKAIEEKLHITETAYSAEIMGSSLGVSFFKETMKAILVAFLFMSIVVFLYFRVPTPSIAVILAAFSDIISTLAVINLLEIKLSAAGISAFLMLIGYSVDTDILLSTRVLKSRTGTVSERIRKAMKTGLMMSCTTLAAVSVGLFFSQSDVLTQIMTILLIGVLFDIVYTWLQNAPILRIYTEKRKYHG